jgi:AcrR family transcriptional regulator
MPSGTSHWERRRERVAAHIEHEAVQLIARDGYAAVTVAAIAVAAGVSPATVARYFPLKEDILLARPRANHQAALRSLASLQGDPKPITGFVRELGRLADERSLAREDFTTWIRAIETAPEVANKAMGETFDVLAEPLADLCAVALGVDARTDPRPSALACAVIAADAAKNSFWARNQGVHDIDELLRTVHESLMTDFGTL